MSKQTSDLLSQKLSWYFNNGHIFPEITDDHLDTQKHFLDETKKLEAKVLELEAKIQDLNWSMPMPDFPPTGH